MANLRAHTVIQAQHKDSSLWEDSVLTWTRAGVLLLTKYATREITSALWTLVSLPVKGEVELN